MHPERNLKLYEFSSIDPILFSLLVLALVLAGYTNKRVALSPSNNLGEQLDTQWHPHFIFQIDFKGQKSNP